MTRFSIPAAPARENKVVVGPTFRFSILTPRLLRLETGNYTDLPTQTVWNRSLDRFDYRIRKEKDFWTVETAQAAFRIDVKKATLVRVTLSDGTVVTDFHRGNLLGTARTLDNVSGAVRLEKGVLSRSGVSELDDSGSLLLGQDGSILPRPACTDRYYFAYGHDYLGCLKDFFRLTGPVPLIPKYALGNWWSRYKAYTQEEYRSLMEEFLRRRLPVTVATIDMDWHWTDVLQRFGEDARPGKPRCKEELLYNNFLPGWTGYSWNTELFPDPGELLSWLHEKNFHVTLNVHPSQGIRYYEDCYPQVCRALGRDPESRKTVEFDITDLAFVEAYLDIAHHPLEDSGVDFWWLDWQQGKNTKVPGLDPLWALNHYHTLDGGRGNQRPLILSRYAGLGSHRYPLGFSGDSHCTWESLRFQPYFTANAANAGYSWWSHDIGGHMQGYQDDELYLRWLQFGVFSPVNRLHSSNSDFMGKEPWKRCWAVSRVAEDFLRLRHRLIPLLYSANYRTHTEGIPVCMPMYYRYDCEDAYRAKDQYLFCGSLLTAPITRPMDRRLNLASARVWLPEGRWTDIFNGRIYRGGGWVTMYRDLDAIPVLAPAGAIAAMYENGETNDLGLGQTLEIHAWRGNGSFELYEDDGETRAFESGVYALTAMRVEERGDSLRFQINPPEGDASIIPRGRKMRVIFRDVRSAAVTVNGAEFQPEVRDCVSVDLVPDGGAVCIELTRCRFAKNPPADTLRTELLTRVQCSNARKAEFSRSLPDFVKKVLQELDNLDYTVSDSISPQESEETL